MPLSYPAGTLAEHRACREDAVAFDVSHLGTVRVTGAGAKDVLQWALTNDLDKVEPGRAQYTHLLDPDDASVQDDIIVWWRAPDAFDVMPNASNTDRVTAALAEAAHSDVAAEGVTHERAVIAVQGPAAREKLRTVAPDAAAIGRFRVAEFGWQGADCIVAGTGYTGEATADAGLALCRQRGAAPEVVLVAAEREAGVSRRLTGLAVEGRRPPREGQTVLIGGLEAGTITSGNFSPVLEHGIAMAFLPPGLEVGTIVEIDVRGTSIPARVVDLPFVG